MTPARRVALLADKPAGALMIHEIYRSLQGESTFAGLPCVFVRTAVCDSRCVWCDTPHAFNQGTVMTADAVFDRVMAFDTRLVELTGGEPLLQAEVIPLMTRFADAGKTVLLETSGAHDTAAIDPRVHIILDVKCPDSGESERNHWPNLARLKPIDEVKFVVASRRDFDWTVNVVREHDLIGKAPVLVSGVYGGLTPQELAAWVLETGLDLRMQLQLHKYVWGANARGV